MKIFLIFLAGSLHGFALSYAGLKRNEWRYWLLTASHVAVVTAMVLLTGGKL